MDGEDDRSLLPESISYFYLSLLTINYSSFLGLLFVSLFSPIHFPIFTSSYFLIFTISIFSFYDYYIDIFFIRFQEFLFCFHIHYFYFAFLLAFVFVQSITFLRAKSKPSPRHGWRARITRWDVRAKRVCRTYASPATRAWRAICLKDPTSRLRDRPGCHGGSDC